jgi:hypothetical protein
MALNVERRTPRCVQVVPAWQDGTKPNCSDRWDGKTIGFQMTKEQALELTKILMIVAEQAGSPERIHVTVHRDQKSRDGTFPIQVHPRSP